MTATMYPDQFPHPEGEHYEPYEQSEFGQVITAMVTPHTKDGEAVDYAVAEELANYLERHGSQGLVVAGTTGEAPTLSDDEQIELAKVVSASVDIPVIVGTGSNDTRHAAELTRRVETETAADAVLVVSPYYNKPSQEGITHYFKSVAGSTGLPLIMYNIPGRTGGDGISDDTILRLSDVDNIVGLKQATGRNSETWALSERLRDAGNELLIYSGDDASNRELWITAGSVGAISVASHWAGEEMAEMYRALELGDEEFAMELDRIMTPSYEFESTPAHPNPEPTKAMMRVLGINVGQGRPPVMPTDEVFEAQAQELLDGLPSHNDEVFARLLGSFASR